jgi:hypothetical protein
MHMTTNSTIKHVRLIFAAAGSSAVLEVTTASGHRVVADLDARHARTLRVLQDAFEEDVAAPAALRGLRHPRRIAEELDPQPMGYTPGIPAIRAYLSQIRRRLRDASAKLGIPSPIIHKSVRLAGVRLLQSIEIEYLDRPRES